MEAISPFFTNKNKLCSIPSLLCLSSASVEASDRPFGRRGRTQKQEAPPPRAVRKTEKNMSHFMRSLTFFLHGASRHPLSDGEPLGPFTVGQSARLKCTAQGGQPTPNVTWWRDGKVADETFHATVTGRTGPEPNGQDEQVNTRHLFLQVKVPRDLGPATYWWPSPHLGYWRNNFKSDSNPHNLAVASPALFLRATRASLSFS